METLPMRPAKPDGTAQGNMVREPLEALSRGNDIAAVGGTRLLAAVLPAIYDHCPCLTGLVLSDGFAIDQNLEKNS